MGVEVETTLGALGFYSKTIYHVAYSASIGALSHEVNGLMLDGWQLQGGVSVSTRDEGGADRHLFAQALVKAVPR